MYAHRDLDIQNSTAQLKAVKPRLSPAFSKPGPSLECWPWLGSGFLKAGAPTSRAKAGASRPSRAGKTLDYLDRVVEEDNYMVESWKGDADGMLTFVGL